VSFDGPGTVSTRNFFSELKWRNVYKVAAAYAVVGWLAIQVTATIVPALHLPDGLTDQNFSLSVTPQPTARRNFNEGGLAKS